MEQQQSKQSAAATMGSSMAAVAAASARQAPGGGGCGSHGRSMGSSTSPVPGTAGGGRPASVASPGSSESGGGSGTPPGGQASSSYNPQKISGIPCVAAASRYTAPVHIDVGGSIYTSSLETLTRHPESKLAKMFNGSIPIVLDSLKQHYFIDRDGKMFRHVLNFLRTNSLVIPESFEELDLLCEEVRFYEITPLMRLLEHVKQERNNRMNPELDGTLVRASDRSLKNHPRLGNLVPVAGGAGFRSNGKSAAHRRFNNHECYANHQLDAVAAYADGEPETGFQCLALNICPDLGERIMVSGERTLIEESFPEISQGLMDARSGAAWNTDSKNVIRFPLNGFCKLNSLQTIARLLNQGFRIMASHGGGVEGQQFSEYLFGRRSGNPL